MIHLGSRCLKRATILGSPCLERATALEPNNAPQKLGLLAPEGTQSYPGRCDPPRAALPDAAAGPKSHPSAPSWLSSSSVTPATGSELKASDPALLAPLQPTPTLPPMRYHKDRIGAMHVRRGFGSSKLQRTRFPALKPHTAPTALGPNSSALRPNTSAPSCSAMPMSPAPTSPSTAGLVRPTSAPSASSTTRITKSSTAPATP